MTKTFIGKLKTATLSKREIPVTDTHFYLKKNYYRIGHPGKRYVVTKIFQRGTDRSFLYFTSTTDEEVAKRASIKMCELINEEIRRRDAEAS